ncbi:MAG: fumarylacetoacetate hydrolase family protein, partial [Bacteroidota bacterium]
MKLISYRSPSGKDRVALWAADQAWDAGSWNSKCGPDMTAFLEQGEAAMDALRGLEQRVLQGDAPIKPLALEAKDWLAPVPKPASCRDGYAFRQHVASARRNRGVDMI